MPAVLSVAFELLMWLFILRAAADFIPALRQSAIGQALQRITEPILIPLRRVIRPMTFGDAVVDLSPVVLVLLIYSLVTLI